MGCHTAVMSREKCISFAICLLSVLPFAAARADSIQGKVSVIDGTRFRIVNSGVTVKLYGISSCGISQRAHFQGVSWPCGAVSAGWLTENTLGYWITCIEEEPAGYATVFARCFLPDGSDIAKKALAEGMAISTRDAGILIVPEYGSFEEIARSKSIGIWSSTFEIDGQTYRNQISR